jgi:hypothetical protein
MQWYQYLFFAFYGFALGVGLRFIFKAPGLKAYDVWVYINANTKELLKSGLCWLLVFGLWVTAPQWAAGMKWTWLAEKVVNFQKDAYWSPLVAWLADSIVMNLLAWLLMIMDEVKKKIKPPEPPADGV